MPSAQSETETLPNSTLPLKTLDREGKVPPSRLDKIIDALTVVSTLMEASKERLRRAAIIKGQFDGNPPFNPQKLRANGLAWSANFNTLEARAYKNNALVPYYDLFASGPVYSQVSLDIDDRREQSKKSGIVTEEWDRSLRDDDDFEQSFWRLFNDFIGFGKGWFLWPNPVSIRFEHIPWYRILVPDGTTTSLRKWELFAVLHVYEIHELYRKIRNEESAKKAGWIPGNVIQAIRQAAPYDPSLYDDYVGLQQQLKDHDLYVTARSDKVFCASVYVKEFDGKWTQIVVPVDRYISPGIDYYSPYGERKVDPEKTGFLFKHTHWYDDIRQIISPFFLEVDDGSVNGLSGLGKDIVAPMQVKDRLRMAQLNNTFMRSSIVLQQRTPSGKVNGALQQIGNATIIGPDFAIQNSTVLADIESTIAVNRDLDMMLQSNVGVYKPNPEKPPGNPEPAQTSQMRMAQSTVLSNTAVNRWHQQADRFYTELFRRYCLSGEKEAVRFREWCKKRGVESADLKRLIQVRSYRNVGNGSVFIRQQSSSALLALRELLPQEGMNALAKDVVAAYAGQQKVESYFPDVDESMPGRDQWEARTENGIMKGGSPTNRIEGQDDEEHLKEHSQAIVAALGSLKQGAEPEPAVVFAQGVLAHSVEHLAGLNRKNPKLAKEWKQRLSALGSAVGKLKSLLAQRQQRNGDQSQKQQKVMNDEQLKEFQTRHKMQLSEEKTRHMMKLKQESAAQKVRLEQIQAAQEMELADTKTAAEITRKRFSAFTP